jgi:CRP-like cAMP-binding protein
MCRAAGVAPLADAAPPKKTRNTPSKLIKRLRALCCGMKEGAHTQSGVLAPQSTAHTVAEHLAAVHGGNVRLLQLGPSSPVGELDWVLQRPMCSDCLAITPARVAMLSRDRYSELANTAPAAAALVMQLLLQSTALSAVHAMQELGGMSL